MKFKQILASFFLAIMMISTPVFAGDHMVDINSATAEQLQEVKGIGDKTAMAIVAYRNKHGAYKKVGDLLHVKGIGEKKLAKIKDSLTIGNQDD
ncbi:competence protein ComEA [Mariprofundus micogutta]|uniref:Competence protein ComEA n=1 Tax=Mariprofundus micogutta TaxID=1921010 RepID=A0A1L8CLG5_9PROT|nr:ComEA family DNA-binding protein [Mariprofundus micogutta]GAV19758.1 competence protein ComEA [Mariprofundus micogutta]